MECMSTMNQRSCQVLYAGHVVTWCMRKSVLGASSRLLKVVCQLTGGAGSESRLSDPKPASLGGLSDPCHMIHTTRTCPPEMAAVQMRLSTAGPGHHWTGSGYVSVGPSHLSPGLEGGTRCPSDFLPKAKVVKRRGGSFGGGDVGPR